MDFSTHILHTQLALVLVLGGAATAWSAETVPADDRAFFENKIRPVLVRECYRCHSAGSVDSKTKLK